MSLSSWLVAGIVPGVERQPLKKLAVDESALLKLLNRWREQAAGQLVISVDTKEELIGNFRTAARTIGPRAARSTLRSVALFCRVLGEAFGNIVANLATSFGATGTSNFGRPRLRRTAPRFRRSAQPSESGPLRRAVRLTTGTTADPPAGACPMARYEPIWTGADS
jgi:hypothetical protein